MTHGSRFNFEIPLSRGNGLVLLYLELPVFGLTPGIDKTAVPFVVSPVKQL